MASEMVERVARRLYATVLKGAGCEARFDWRPPEVRAVS